MNFSVAESELRPLVVAIVAEVLATIERDPSPGNRLAYSEPEAAGLLGVKPHVLRDARIRGEITPTKCGGRLAYEREELQAYLTRNRITY